MEKPNRKICLMNDTFPPQIDGVSNAVYNYASEIEKNFGESLVLTPEYPGYDDSSMPFPVLRYPSIDTTKTLGVVAGLPFSPKIMKELTENPPDILHCHCPSASQVLARLIRGAVNAPLIMTYHTKYDIDIRKVIKLELISERIIASMITNISASDEVWTVSRGAGENLRSLGYEGNYYIMQNGVDIPHERVPEDFIRRTVSGYGFPEGIPVLLFVGRLMWYKGFRTILDALAGLKANGFDFRMVIVGTGGDEEEILQYARDAGVFGNLVLIGALHDREQLRAWYSFADLLVFPSTFDTNGLVVREAAACSTATMLVRGSAAAEGVTDLRNGYLTDDSGAAFAVKIYQAFQDRDKLRQTGENAGNELYISWNEAVRRACERYEVVLDNYRSGKSPKHKGTSDGLLDSLGELMSQLSSPREPED